MHNLNVQFLTLKEAAKFLRIGVLTLNRLIRNEGLPSYKIGGRRLLEKGELIKWVKKHKYPRKEAKLVV